MGKKQEVVNLKTAVTESLAKARAQFHKLADGLETSKTFARDLLQIQGLRVQIDDLKRKLADA